jgi:glycosyltransferase involved in cell wall biosynthesis
MSARVTWLLPVKNGMPFLSETLSSIAEQTFRDFEVLAWDNGSTDGTVAELHNWIPARLPGEVIADRPAALGACLAQMVCHARSEFCARIDADDINMPDRLETQLSFLRSSPETAVVGSQAEIIDENGQELAWRHCLPLDHDDILHRMLHSFVFIHPSVLFSREAVLRSGNYRNVALIEDYDLWMRIARNHKLVNINRNLIKYRVHGESTVVKAIEAGTMDDAVLRCFADNALDLFGCSANNAMRLRNRRHPFPLLQLLQITAHLCSTQGGAMMGRIRSDSWKEAAAKFLLRRHMASRLFVRLCPRLK